ncbi:MAG TPA: cupredoxin family copper-binding protein [Terriglobales bacterium]|nr:cupredoxin family copper-binding protein [Terriglobales bacterium]
MKMQRTFNPLGSAIMLFVLCMAVIAISETGLRVAAAAETTPAAAEIKIDNFSFTPRMLTVQAGTKVTWTNRDDIPHNIVSSEHKFKSKPLDTDDAYSFTFTEAGTYQYFCGLHPKMVGKVVVEAKK